MGISLLLAKANPLCAACTQPILALILATIVTFNFNDPKVTNGCHKTQCHPSPTESHQNCQKVICSSAFLRSASPCDPRRSSIHVLAWRHHHTAVPLGEFCDCNEMTLLLRTGTGVWVLGWRVEQDIHCVTLQVCYSFHVFI